jgi:hypothetical protein
LKLLNCPHCNKPGISVWDKLFMGPVLSANCRICNRSVSVEMKKAMLVMVPIIPTAAISWIAALIILPFISYIYIKWVPLVK